MQKEFYDAMFEIEQIHWWFRGKQKIVLSLLDEYASTLSVGKSLRLLDAGCGCGLMLSALQKYGEVEGMDFSNTAIEYCKKVFHGKLRQCDLNQPLEFEQPFDAVIALDILEHIANDRLALRSLAKALRSNGIAIITVPANPWMWSVHDQNCMHQRRYTKKTLQEACNESGLHVQFLSYYNFYLFPPIAFLRLVEKVLHRKPANKDSMENKVPPRAINQFLYWIFQAEHKRIIRKKAMPFGVSLIAILKRA